MAEATFHVFRGDKTGGAPRTYRVPVTEGMVVLDGIHYIQAHLDGTLACRWNCKAARCGAGPRFMVRVAALEMHPKDTLSRTDLLRGSGGIGFCNITKCCEEVCPEHIHITDNAIIPLKERMADDYFDPWRSLLRVFGKKKEPRGT